MNNYIELNEITRQMKMSPVRLLTFLKDHRKDLPVALHRKAFVLCTDREIREGCLITPWGSDDSCATNKFYAEGREAWLPYLLINRVDWEAYIAKAEPGFFQPEAVRHVALSRPIIFEDILKAWLGEDNALTLLRKYKYNIANDVIDLVRDMENFLLDAAKDSDIAVYGRCMRKGKELFYPLNPYLPLPVYQENKGIAEHFIFRLYHNCADDIVSEPIYFNADEVIQHFPFLKFAENSAMRQHAKNTKNTDKQAESPLPEQFSQNNLVADTQEPLLSQEEKAVKRAAWEAAINNEKREINDMDKAPRAACTRIIRLMNYLDVCLKNKTAFSIKAQDVNIYKNLIIAEKSDVPYMLAKYPSLPALPPRSRQIK